MDTAEVAQDSKKDCLGCKLVGTLTFTAVGLHALNAARPHKPGSPIERRIMGVLGVGKL